MPDRSTNHRLRGLLFLGAVVLAAAVILQLLPRQLTGTATLEACRLGGWPVLVFEGESWKDALPDAVRATAPRQIPIAAWPSGLHYDQAAGALLDANDAVVFRRGARLRIKGSVIEVHGDPSPCYFTFGVRVDEVASP